MSDRVKLWMSLALIFGWIILGIFNVVGDKIFWTAMIAFMIAGWLLK